MAIIPSDLSPPTLARIILYTRVFEGKHPRYEATLTSLYRVQWCLLLALCMTTVSICFIAMHLQIDYDNQ